MDVVRSEGGAALVIVLVALVLVSALGLGVLFVADTERVISSGSQRSVETLDAADAIAMRVVSDLGLGTTWHDVLAAGALSAFVDSSRIVSLPFGGTLDLDRETADVQARTETMWGGRGAAFPQWQLFAWGPLARLLPAGQVGSLQYVAAWVADDRFEADGNPHADTNDTLVIHARGYGFGGALRMVEVVVARVPGACSPAEAYWLAPAGPRGTMRAFRSEVPGLVSLQSCVHGAEPDVVRIVSWREVQ
jgi:hypothetical protein